MRACLLLLLGGPGMAFDNGAPHSKLPPLGWSSWVALGPDWPGPPASAPVFDYCDEASVKASVDAFFEVGLYDAGYRHFHLDDCWADLERNSTGFLQGERDHFPKGMKDLVDYVHSKGLTFGLYTCAGTYTCVGKRPGSKDHWTQDANVFAEWGVDWVKMDWCNTAGMVPEHTYPLMADALNKSGRHIHFNMCEWGKDAPWTWGPKVAQSWRATGDHTGTWESTKSIISQRTAIPQSASGAAFAWNDMDMLETGNYKQAAHANGKQGTMTAAEYKTEFSMWAILASPLVVTTPILNCSKTDQINANFTAGTCKASITALQKEILLNTEVIAINQDVTPAGRLLIPAKDLSVEAAREPGSSKQCALVDQRSQSECKLGASFGCFTNNNSMWTAKGCRGTFKCGGYAHVDCDVMNGAFHVCDCTAPKPTPALVFARNLTGGDIAVALYNPTDVAGPAQFKFTMLGWSDDTTASVRDLWAHRDLGDMTGHFPSMAVQAHATMVLRLTSKTAPSAVVI